MGEGWWGASGVVGLGCCVRRTGKRRSSGTAVLVCSHPGGGCAAGVAGVGVVVVVAGPARKSLRVLELFTCQRRSTHDGVAEAVQSRRSDSKTRRLRSALRVGGRMRGTWTPSETLLPVWSVS